jgi:hypothetical protein
MLLLDPLETAITSGDTLKDKTTRRNWKVKSNHPRYPGSWIIRCGPITRIIFPIDHKDYNIALAN